MLNSTDPDCNVAVTFGYACQLMEDYWCRNKWVLDASWKMYGLWEFPGVMRLPVLHISPSQGIQVSDVKLKVNKKTFFHVMYNFSSHN
jgi:hypothetical protein